LCTWLTVRVLILTRFPPQFSQLGATGGIFTVTYTIAVELQHLSADNVQSRGTQLRSASRVTSSAQPVEERVHIKQQILDALRTVGITQGCAHRHCNNAHRSPCLNFSLSPFTNYMRRFPHSGWLALSAVFGRRLFDDPLDNVGGLLLKGRRFVMNYGIGIWDRCGRIGGLL